MPPRVQDLPSKPCAGCGRVITWRKKWERDWDAVRWCSDACRRRGVRDVDRRLEDSLLALLDARARGATVCPSEAARAVAASSCAAGDGEDGENGADGENGEDWRALMEPARAAARRLVAAGAVEITQGGVVVDPSTARGPIRVRRRRP